MKRILFHIIYTRSCACYNIETIMKDHIIFIFIFFFKKDNIILFKKKKEKEMIQMLFFFNRVMNSLYIVLDSK